MKLNIEAERGRHQLTKEELSAMLGITSKTYLNYVRGTTPIPSDKLEKMSSIFGKTTDYLLGISEERR